MAASRCHQTFTALGVTMKRHQVIQSLLQAVEGGSYLEIGVNRGVTFHEVSVPYKVAVDPQFLFDYAEAERTNKGAEYHQTTSDD